MENTPQEEKSAEKQAETTVDEPVADASQTQTQDTKGAEVDPAKKLQDDLSEAKDKYLRLYAEFENHRRRTAKEKLEMIQSANEQLIKALLPVADDFDRAEKAYREKGDKEAEGFLLIQTKLKKVLEQYGVKAMDAKGNFNPDLHEAITELPGDASMKGKIVDVVEKGYLLGDKVIRFAKVVVGS